MSSSLRYDPRTLSLLTGCEFPDGTEFVDDDHGQYVLYPFWSVHEATNALVWDVTAASMSAGIALVNQNGCVVWASDAAKRTRELLARKVGIPDYVHFSTVRSNCGKTSRDRWWSRELRCSAYRDGCPTQFIVSSRDAHSPVRALQCA